jgi:uncharacterized protein with beta-barrel porin domain
MIPQPIRTGLAVSAARADSDSVKSTATIRIERFFITESSQIQER